MGECLRKRKIYGLEVVKDEMRIKKVIEYFLSSRWYVFLLGIILLLKTIFFYGNTVFKNDTIWLWSIRQTCFFIVIIVFPLLLFKNSIHRFKFGIIINFFISLLLFADELYYTYASNILSVMQTGNIQYKDEILAAIPTLLNTKQVMYFLDLFILAVLLIGKFVNIKQYNNFKIFPVFLTSICILFF